MSSIFNISSRIKKSVIKTDKAMILYTVSAFLNKGISFLVWPYFTYVLTSKDLGILNNYTAFITFLYPWLSMGVLNILNLEYYKKKREDIVNMIYNSMLLSFLLSILLYVVFIYLNKTSTTFFEIDTYYFLFIPVILFLNIATDVITYIYRLEEKPYMFVTISTIKVLVELLLAFILIESFSYGYNARIYGLLVSYILPAFLFFIWLLRQPKNAFYLNYDRIKQTIKYGLFGIVIFIGIFLINSSDRFVVTYYLGIEENGYYSVAVTIASILLAFVTALMNFYTPKLYKDFSKKVSFSIINLNFRKYLFYNFIMYISLIFIGTFLFYFVINIIYIRSLYSFLILLTSYFVWGLFVYFYNILFYLKEFKVIGGLFLGCIIVIYSLILLNQDNLSIEIIPLFQLISTFMILIISYFLIKNRQYSL